MSSTNPPQRTCIACKRKDVQGYFIRLAKPTGLELAVLPSGPSQGRSAYVCPTEPCIKEAFAKGRINHALRQSVPTEELERLRRKIECKPR